MTAMEEVARQAQVAELGTSQAPRAFFASISDRTPDNASQIQDTPRSSQ
jgi:hypothetical protein